MHPSRKDAAVVVATDSWTAPDGLRSPAGAVHAWLPRTNQTLCGRPLSKTGLLEFPDVTWLDVQPARGRDAHRVTAVCPQCTAGMGSRPDEQAWSRTHPHGRDPQIW